MKPKRIEGWQAHVDVYKDYVIKTPKTKEEISKKVSPWLNEINKLEELEPRVNSLHRDIVNSIKLIKKSKVPLILIGNPQFFDNGSIKQEKAVILEDLIKKHLKNKDLKSAKKLIDKFIKLTIKLWQYGICEKTFKFGINFGQIEQKVVMIDLFELTGDKRVVEKLIKKRACDRPWALTKIYPKAISDYYVKQSQKYFTIQYLEKYWKSLSK